MTQYLEYRTWRSRDLKEEDGIIVGSDQTQEWLLPWWWDHYHRHNRFPVTFVDFGLSSTMKQWCSERGEFISLRVANIFVKEREEVDPSFSDEWEKRTGDQVWTSRHAWFKKPLACLQSPYRRTIWLDIDCEVLKPLDALFKCCEHASGIALAKDRVAPTPSYPIYNSGVIVFKRNVLLIKTWADQSFEQNESHRGDQDLLSKIISDQALDIGNIPDIYNWPVGSGIHPEMAICHWLGDMGKSALRNQLIKDDRLLPSDLM